MKMLFGYLNLACLAVLSGIAFAVQAFSAFVSELFVVAFPVSWREGPPRLASTETIVQSVGGARRRSYVARMLETLDFGRQPGIYAARC